MPIIRQALKGRRTEAGPLPSSYLLLEMSSPDYRLRTEKNVIEADATLLVSHGPLRSGTLLTRMLAEKHGRPWLHIDCSVLAPGKAAREAEAWLRANRIGVLNVAGPRASNDAEIYAEVKSLVKKLLQLKI